MPLRVGQKSEGGPKPFSTEWILAPPEEAPPRYAPELPAWIPSERKSLALFIIVLSIIISIGGSSGRQSNEPVENENKPVVQTPVVQITPTAGSGVIQPTSVARSTEPLPPPRPTATAGANAAPTQAP